MLALVRTGLARQKAYEMVQKHALAAAAGTASGASFRALPGRRSGDRCAPVRRAIWTRHSICDTTCAGRAIIDRALGEQDT